MANYRGLLAVVEYETATPGTWATLVGVTDMTFTIRNNLGEEERIDITADPAFVEVLQYYGAQSLTLSYNGLFDSAAAGIMAADAARGQTQINLRVYIPGDGYYEADWAISQIEFQRGSTGGLQHSAQLASSGFNPSTGYTADS